MAFDSPSIETSCNILQHSFKSSSQPFNQQLANMWVILTHTEFVSGLNTPFQRVFDLWYLEFINNDGRFPTSTLNLMD
jgi:hypothetical protein